MSAGASPWPAALTSAGVAVVIAVVLSLGLAALTSPVDAGAVTGAAGSDGADGADGLDGADGRDGVDGLDGIRGATGPAGNDGADGRDGRDGRDGADGAHGADGIDGADGADGATGATGATGPTGPPGVPGATGPTGATGAPGADAVLAFAEGGVVAGVYGETGAGGYLSTATFDFISNPGPGTYILIFHADEITQDMTSPTWVPSVFCSLVGPVQGGNQQFLEIPWTSPRHFTDGATTKSKGHNPMVGATRSVTVTGPGTISVQCQSRHSVFNAQDKDADLTLVFPSAVLTRRPW
jgi:hypothetical protein